MFDIYRNGSWVAMFLFESDAKQFVRLRSHPLQYVIRRAADCDPADDVAGSEEREGLPVVAEAHIPGVRVAESPPTEKVAGRLSQSLHV